MSSPEINGIALGDLECPIRYALAQYAGELSGGKVSFDYIKATVLEPTPDKPNSARSVSEATFKGEPAGTLYTIAFAPGDGTGDFSAYRRGSLDLMHYPDEPAVYPRSKEGVHAEVQFPLLEVDLEADNPQPVLFGGELALLSVYRDFSGSPDEPSKKLAQFGTLKAVRESGAGADSAPTGTNLTTGYLSDVHTDFRPERFGDPHAVYLPIGASELVVCSFLAIPNVDRERLAPMMESLNAQKPSGLVQVSGK